jgi:hypothetical protein
VLGGEPADEREVSTSAVVAHGARLPAWTRPGVGPLVLSRRACRTSGHLRGPKVPADPGPPALPAHPPGAARLGPRCVLREQGTGWARSMGQAVAFGGAGGRAERPPSGGARRRVGIQSRWVWHGWANALVLAWLAAAAALAGLAAAEVAGVPPWLSVHAFLLGGATTGGGGRGGRARDGAVAAASAGSAASSRRW